MAAFSPMVPWVARANIAREIRDDSIAKVEPPIANLPKDMPQNSQNLPKLTLTTRELELTESYSFSELLAKLQSRELSSEELTRAFLRRSAVAHAATNCLTELMWEDAIDRARYLDSLPTPIGRLHGFPISTKEHLGTKGRNKTSNASYVSYIGNHHESTVLLDTLWNAGCVFIARTTQPQSIMQLETESNIYGRTVNPYNKKLTPGGSTGGEGALVGMRGSLLGVGGDIGGSIRVPAAHCGIYGFKPSVQRLPGAGAATHMVGKETVLATNGPMATDRDALNLFMEVILAAEPWLLEPSIRAAPWIPYHVLRPLKIAVQWWDGVVQPHPPITRALREVSEACKAAGHVVIDWDCEKPDAQDAWKIIQRLYFPDGGEQVRNLLDKAGEPYLPLTEFILNQPHVAPLEMHELWELCAERDAFRTAFARFWSSTGNQDGQEVDVILCAPNFGAATPHGQSKYWGYSSFWNLLDYPAVVFPVTTVDPEKDQKDVLYLPKNPDDQFIYDLYNAESFEDAPVSLQVVGRRHQDEKVLAALETIENAMGRK